MTMQATIYENDKAIDFTNIYRISDLRIANRVYDTPRLRVRVVSFNDDETTIKSERWYRVYNGKVVKENK